MHHFKKVVFNKNPGLCPFVKEILQIKANGFFHKNIFYNNLKKKIFIKKKNKIKTIHVSKKLKKNRFFY